MSLPRYPEYKPSGVEWLSEVSAAWNVKRLRFAAQLNASKSELRTSYAMPRSRSCPMEAVGDKGRNG